MMDHSTKAAYVKNNSAFFKGRNTQLAAYQAAARRILNAMSERARDYADDGITCHPNNGGLYFSWQNLLFLARPEVILPPSPAPDLLSQPIANLAIYSVEVNTIYSPGESKYTLLSETPFDQDATIFGVPVGDCGDVFFSQLTKDIQKFHARVVFFDNTIKDLMTSEPVD